MKNPCKIGCGERFEYNVHNVDCDRKNCYEICGGESKHNCELAHNYFLSDEGLCSSCQRVKEVFEEIEKELKEMHRVMEIGEVELSNVLKVLKEMQK